MLTDREIAFRERFLADRRKEREAHLPIGRIMGMVGRRRGERAEIETTIDLITRKNLQLGIITSAELGTSVEHAVLDFADVFPDDVVTMARAKLDLALQIMPRRTEVTISKTAVVLVAIVGLVALWVAYPDQMSPILVYGGAYSGAVLAILGIFLPPIHHCLPPSAPQQGRHPNSQSVAVGRPA